MAARSDFLWLWKFAIGLPKVAAAGEPTCLLTPSARHVARVLSEHMSSDGSSCFPSLELIASESGITRASVCRALKQLEKEKYLRRQRGAARGRRPTSRSSRTRKESASATDS